MSIKHAWIPAAAAAVLFVGCDSKPADRVPTTAPTAIKEPYEVLKHLQYVAVRKDLKHLPVIAPVDPDVVYPSSWWFNKHAGEMGISLTDQEITDLGVADLKAMGYLAPGVSHKDLQDGIDKVGAKILPKLPPEMEKLDLNKLDLMPNDKLPNGKPNPDFETVKSKYARAALNAGLYRLLKAVPEGMWPDVNVMEVKPDATNKKIQGVFLGYKGTTIIQLGLIQNKDMNYGVSYVYFKVMPRKLQAMLTADKQ